jgi:uncharacterized surface protein with fasciclin (FAS1) repeats
MAVRMWMMLMLVALGAAPATAQVSIYSVVKGNDDFSTLGALLDALDGKGEAAQAVFEDVNDPTSTLTVFAPTNDAIVSWINVNYGTVAEATANVAFIIELLSYHAVPAAVRS